MSLHEPDFSIPVDDPEWLNRLKEFLLANGYAEGADALVFTRGQEGASWYSSDMSKLRTRLQVHQEPETIRLSYAIQIKGQRLTEEDKAFWEKEAEFARTYLQGSAEKPRDLRSEEALRARRVTEDLRRQGLWAASVVFFIIFVGTIVVDRLGLPLPF